MYRKHGTHPASGRRIQGGFECLGRQETGLAVHIGENDLSAGHMRRVRGRSEGHGGNDHAIARSQLQRQSGEVQRRRPARADDGMGRTNAIRQGALEALDHRPRRKPLAPEYGDDGVDIVIIEAGPTIR